ncbi:ATP-binding protein [Kitasatospora viridis]|uniref:Anti-sigma regulatory factor (Ser/Thr protein kinase) n=1 Tax=Kitasatospora viridis TaxID=281105 RepID=A0A561TSI3_9ACTN|nr:ATP-binding protein [Kitasatospora viridis]TWF90050.1 anti-sigma regulatory factor (Ser/Thr protein kinase) [Kitasatospora viridis]
MAFSSSSPTTAAPVPGTADSDGRSAWDLHGGARPVALRVLPASPAAVPALRRFAREAARGWHLDDAVVDRLLLVVSELATNAVLHSGSQDVALLIEHDGADLTVEVRDWGRWRSRLLPRHVPPGGDPVGRGLELVRRSSSRWLVRACADGTRVLACLTVSAAAAMAG